MAISIYFLLFFIPKVASITFDMTNITQQNHNQIVTSGVASITAAGIQLTPDETHGAAGRATYNKSLHLWDKNSTELASFSTNFSFEIESRVLADLYGDGFTFFLAADNSVITEASALGLPIDNITFAVTDQVVAVEFDTYWNDGVDPVNISGPHVGIDVNSLSSSKYKIWSINITEGANCQAQIKYDSMSKNLSVSVTDTEYGVIGFDYIIDFRRLLPEWVIFGFTAATGGRYEKVTVKSWTFNSSSLQVNETKAQPLKEKNKTGLVVGLIVGSCVLLTFLALCSFSLEIACGRKPIEQTAPEKQVRLIKWVWELYETGSLLDVVDPRLETNFEEEEFKRLVIVGLWCVHPNAEHRPSMTQVYHVLNSDVSLPVPPSRMLVPSYMTSPSTPLTGVISSN
ncbi:hypothetical protein QVD17_27405 [Tagetes erecta]|uniref:Legume lectin domain-containing protein n=1 Tax=Tagetes erecta TaxID=13708 RepID=A0AAD8NRC1_TARER|nr:hypothetical protein QVD17_27405 [Tagetes erecta]